MAHPLVFEQRLIQAWPPERWQDVTVLVAVSGGPDSVALLRALAAVRAPGGGQLVAAHFNHAVRGALAQADQDFVVDVCDRLGLRCEVGRAAWPADAGCRPRLPADRSSADGADPSVGDAPSEAVLRAARYRFLCQAAQRVGARYVAMGHTADDQAETVLQRILRGTGIAGLAGMPRHRQLMTGVALVRPLLDISRRQVLDYLETLGQQAREDHSNDDVRYTRNRIRRQLLPHLAARYNADVVMAVTRLSGLARDVQDVVAGVVDDLQERAVQVESPDAAHIDCRELGSASQYLVRELLMAVWRLQEWPQQAMGFRRWDELADLASTAPRGPLKKMFPGAIAAQRAGARLTLRRLRRRPSGDC